MNLSGILVVAAPAHLDEVAAALAALPGVEVHHREAASGRLIVVQEAQTVEQEVDGLRRIQHLPHVALAELVYHYFADNAVFGAPAPSGRDGVPRALAEPAQDAASERSPKPAP